jgi:hypothetical protein
MTSITIGNIRLAAGSDRSGILYNAYHLLTQMSALYAHFSQYAQTAEQKKFFAGFSDGIIMDIGNFYIAWEGLDKKNNQEVPNGWQLAERVIHTCSQFLKIMQLTNEWTPFTKTTDLSILCEKRWRSILIQLCVGAGKEAAVLNELRKVSEDREQSQCRERDKYRVADRRTQDAFDSADFSLLEKSFGF